jgi:hypothetical protein
VVDWVGQDGPAPARSALELALYDRIARQRELPLYQLLGVPRPDAKPTSFTIAIETPEEMARRPRILAVCPAQPGELAGHPLFDFAHLASEIISQVLATQVNSPQEYLQKLSDLSKHIKNLFSKSIRWLSGSLSGCMSVV